MEINPALSGKRNRCSVCKRKGDGELFLRMKSSRTMYICRICFESVIMEWNIAKSNYNIARKCWRI